MTESVESVPTFAHEAELLKDFINTVYKTTQKKGEIIMRGTDRTVTILTDELKMFRPMLYKRLDELRFGSHRLALFRVIRDCAEDIRVKETPDRRMSDTSLFVILVCVSELVGFSTWIDLNDVVANLSGWVLVNKKWRKEVQSHCRKN